MKSSIKILKKVGTIGSLLIASALQFNTFAADIRLGIPGYGGSGCPAGTASVTLSPDAKQISILFDSYIAEAGSNFGRSLDRKSCNLAIPVSVPAGMSVSVFKTDYRGFVAIPAGGMSRFSVEYFFAGQAGPVATKSWYGPYNQDYLLSKEVTGYAWSECGADVNLRVNTSMLAASNSYGQQAMATVDSVDVDGRLVYHLQYRRCY